MSANKATKPGTRKDYGQVLQSAFNEQDSSLTIATFLTGKIGFKIVRTDTVLRWRYSPLYSSYSL
jgi:hypothetical protein